MPPKPLVPCLVAHISFLRAVRSAAELRHVYQEFSRLGKLVRWTDYWSKAGFQHHSARSMAVFQVDQWEKPQLQKRLESIVGLLQLSDYLRLKDGVGKVEKDVRPRFKSSKAVQITHATLDDPFFRAVNPGDAEGVRISAEHSIPMIVTTQDLT